MGSELTPSRGAPSIYSPIHRNKGPWARAVEVVAKKLDTTSTGGGGAFDVLGYIVKVGRSIRDPVAEARPYVDGWVLECSGSDCGIDLVIGMVVWQANDLQGEQAAKDGALVETLAFL